VISEVLETALEQDDDSPPLATNLASLLPDEPNVFLILREALANLTEQQRRVIEARFWQGYNETEIGGMLGVSQGMVNKHKRQAIDALREALSKVV